MPELEKLEYLDVDKLVPLQRLLRKKIDDDRIRELALSIKEHGLINPITVRPHDGYYQIVAGYCRWMAHRWIGREIILCRIRDIGDDDIDYIAGIENLQRLELNPIEESLLCKKLYSEHENSIQEISKLLAKSETWVRSRLEVLTWPEKFIDALGEKKQSMSALSELVKIGDEHYRNHLLRIACENGVTAGVCMGWRLAWEQTNAYMPDEDLKSFRAHVEHPEMRITLVCWGCSQELIPSDLSYKPLCIECVQKVS